MSVLNLVLYPDDPLTQRAKPFDVVGSDVAKLKDDMLDTMRAYEGVGLAGPQVGIRKRIFVMQEPDGEALCILNPEILESEGHQTGEEGCLSLPEIYTDVIRAERIIVRALDEYGRTITVHAEGYAARIIQHEIDHLDGVIFLDRVDIITRQTKLAEWEEVRARLMVAAKR